MKRFMEKNKKGWLQVLEVFIAISLLMGLVFVILDKNIGKVSESSIIEQKEAQFLQRVESNQTLRGLIVNVGTTPLSSEDASFPEGIGNVSKEFFNNLNCTAIICSLDQTCLFNAVDDKSIYTRDVAIFTDGTNYDPKKLAIYCYGDE